MLFRRSPSARELGIYAGTVFHSTFPLFEYVEVQFADVVSRRTSYYRPIIFTIASRTAKNANFSSYCRKREPLETQLVSIEIRFICSASYHCRLALLPSYPPRELPPWPLSAVSPSYFHPCLHTACAHTEHSGGAHCLTECKTVHAPQSRISIFDWCDFNGVFTLKSGGASIAVSACINSE